MTSPSLFSRFSKTISQITGEPMTFGLAICLVVVWAISGPPFHYSDTWQLVMNTFSSIVTFLMVFLIQNTQNRDVLALHLKLNELIRAVRSADNSLMEIEQLSETDLLELDRKYRHIVKELLAGKKEAGSRRDPRE